MNILFVTATTPFPPNTGDRQRTNLLLRALKSQGSVDTLLLQPEDRVSSEDRQRLVADFGLVSCLPPLTKRPRRGLRKISPRLAAGIRHLGMDPADKYKARPEIVQIMEDLITDGEYGVIVGRYLPPTAQAGAFRYAPLVVDVDDLDTAVLRSMMQAPTASLARRLLMGRNLSRMRDVVTALLGKADVIWVPNEHDAHTIGRSRAVVVPNVPFQSLHGSSRRLTPARDPVILIVASFLYQVNVRAVDRFIYRIWPEIHDAMPSGRLHIVGTGLRDDQRDRWGTVPGVDVFGYVDDLEPAYGQAAFTVAPIFEGGGTNIKVLESLAYGRTCVVTPHVHSGFESILEHEEHLLVADEPHLAEACVRLLLDSELRGRLAERGYHAVTQHFTYQRLEEIVAVSLAQAAAAFPDGVVVRETA